MIPNAHRMFNFDLGDTADAIRETVHSFRRTNRAARRRDRPQHQFPRDLWPKIGALGLHGITVEEEYGGTGLGYLEHCIAVEEMSRPQPQSACPTAPIPTSASTRSAATAASRRSEIPAES